MSDKKHVQLKEDDVESHQSGRTVTTMKYDLKALKLVQEFEEWVDRKLGELSEDDTEPLEIDFERVMAMDAGDRKSYLKSALRSMPDHRKRDKFIAEYLVKASATFEVMNAAMEGSGSPKKASSSKSPSSSSKSSSSKSSSSKSSSSKSKSKSSSSSKKSSSK